MKIVDLLTIQINFRRIILKKFIIRVQNIVVNIYFEHDNHLLLKYINVEIYSHIKNETNYINKGNHLKIRLFYNFIENCNKNVNSIK